MIILLLLGLSIIYITWGFLPLIQIIIWLIVLFLSNFLLGLNPDSRELQVIRIMSVLTIIIIIYYNTTIHSIANMSILLPFSREKITFIHDFKKELFVKGDGYSSLMIVKPRFDYSQESHFLNSLGNIDNYILNILFISDIKSISKNMPRICLSDSILINKSSYPSTLSNHIQDQLDVMRDIYLIDESILLFPSGFVLNYSKVFYE
jgi:hypothetical protein